MRVTTNELVELSGIPLQTLRVFVETGVVVPAVRGAKGRGSSHEFSLMQVVGVTYAAMLREVGCSLEWFTEAARFVSAMDEEELLQGLSDGLTFVYPQPGNSFLVKPVRSKKGNNDDLKTAYTRVKDWMETREAEATDRRLSHGHPQARDRQLR